MRVPLDVTILLDDIAVASETLMAAIGPDVVLITTTLPDHVIRRVSTYLGDGRAETIAAALIQVRGQSTSTTRRLDEACFPVREARRLLLLDHAAQLQQDLTGELPARVAVHVPDLALQVADHLYPIDPSAPHYRP